MTNPAEEALSAMVSQILICQLVIRLSTTSMDGTYAAVAASTSSSVQSSPGRSAARMNPTSTSTRGNRNLDAEAATSSNSSISANRCP
ncbi:Uncharacterised protein [Mycobacteroides abscessus subsp. abscessus]|nr:Uncharacterised protein [Mycobacteroides abscessus subsp. abscessus]